MTLKGIAARVFASIVARKTKRWSSHPWAAQEKVFQQLMKKGSTTLFGRDHEFDQIRSHQEFVKKVPVRDYEDLRSYIDKMVAGEPDILWPGRPLYLAKTSGTTSGASEKLTSFLDSLKIVTKEFEKFLSS